LCAAFVRSSWFTYSRSSLMGGIQFKATIKLFWKRGGELEGDD
jgi:hypothetical protein